MFWEIVLILLGVAVLVTVILLSIPFSFRLRMDRLDHVEASAWYGPINLWPDGSDRMEHFYNGRLRPLIERFRGGKKKDEPDTDDAFFEQPEEKEPSEPPPAGEPPSASLDQPEEEPPSCRTEDQAPKEPAPPDEAFEEVPGKPEEDVQPEPPEDEFFEEPPEFDDFFGEEEAPDREHPTGREIPPAGKQQIDELKAKLDELSTKYKQVKAYYDRYGVLGKRILKRFIRLLIDYWFALRWKHLYVRFATGGDPASLGATLGWLHAIDGALEGRLNGHIIFEPDFEDHTFQPEAEAVVDLRVHLILFIPPTVGFLVRFPWIGALKTAYTLRKEQSR